MNRSGGSVIRPDAVVNDPGILVADDFFNDAELGKIVSLVQGRPLREAMVSGTREPRVDYEYRVCRNLRFAADSEAFKWIYERVFACVDRLNRLHWKFALQPEETEMEYNEYAAEHGAHFAWHSDRHDSGPRSRRRLTMVVQLSRPAEYAGGELQMRTAAGETLTCSRERGATMLFTGDVEHRVTRIVRGTRKSLVAWFSSR